MPSNMTVETPASPAGQPKATPPSSALFATAPVHALLQLSVTDMSPEQLRTFVQHMRLLRTSPPTFSKTLRGEEDSEELSESKATTKPRKAKSSKPKRDIAAD